MGKEGLSFQAWLAKAGLQPERLNDEQLAVLKAAFRFLEQGGRDYASRRLVEHFLLHSEVGLKVAQVARLVGLDRCTSSRHRACSSSQVVQSIHNRQAGREARGRGRGRAHEHPGGHVLAESLGPAAAGAFFFAHTQYAGAFLMLPAALDRSFRNLVGFVRR